MIMYCNMLRVERWPPPALITGCGYPQLPLFLKNGWPPPPRIVLQCIIRYYTILSGITMYYTVLCYTTLYYTI